MTTRNNFDTSSTGSEIHDKIRCETRTMARDYEALENQLENLEKEGVEK